MDSDCRDIVGELQPSSATKTTLREQELAGDSKQRKTNRPAV